MTGHLLLRIFLLSLLHLGCHPSVSGTCTTSFVTTAHQTARMSCVRCRKFQSLVPDHPHQFVIHLVFGSSLHHLLNHLHLQNDSGLAASAEKLATTHVGTSDFQRVFFKTTSSLNLPSKGFSQSQL